MVDSLKRTKIVGSFIRQRREALNLSQRSLGQMFSPAVTTQFISNVERGVTPFPPAHVPTLARVLQVPEGEIMTLLEREYALKLSGRLGRTGGELPLGEPGASGFAQPVLHVQETDLPFMRSLYDAYQRADAKARQAFLTVCESILNLPKKE